jgi:hypothetical protein
MAKERGMMEEGNSSNSQTMESLWNYIWKMKGSMVVKTFQWQACNDILPTNEQLFKQHVTLDPLCPICGLESETLRHALWSCPSAKDMWLECVPQIHKCTSDVANFIYIFEKLIDRLDVDQMHIVATIARQIWLQRNVIIF